MKSKLLILGIMVINIAFGQIDEHYNSLKNEAWSLYESKDYKQSAAIYKRAFDVLEGKAMPTDRYNAACSYALSENIDTAFYHLYRLANDSKYKNIKHLTTDKDLNELHKDKRWPKLITIVEANIVEAEKDYDMDLKALLDTVYETDQRFRRLLSSTEKDFGRDSQEMNDLWDTIITIDSINQEMVCNIIDQRGWLGQNIVGINGNKALFLVVQHADLDIQLKYLPIMREAVEKGNARGSSFALLQDRVALRLGKRQIYGSQIGRDEEGSFFVSPMIDPENVNKRRADVGLGSIESYVKHWDMTWDLEKHKAKTIEVEAELGNE